MKLEQCIRNGTSETRCEAPVRRITIIGSGSESLAGSVPALVAVCMCLVWSTLDHDSGSESLAGSVPALVAVCMCLVWSSLDHDSGSESLAGSVPALAVCMCVSGLVHTGSRQTVVQNH